MARITSAAVLPRLTTYFWFNRFLLFNYCFALFKKMLHWSLDYQERSKPVSKPIFCIWIKSNAVRSTFFILNFEEQSFCSKPGFRESAYNYCLLDVHHLNDALQQKWNGGTYITSAPEKKNLSILCMTISQPYYESIQWYDVRDFLIGF